MIRIGERIGKQAAHVASALPAPKYANVKGSSKLKIGNGDVGEFLEGLRTSLNLGKVVSEESTLPVLGEYDVVVLGGGTAGAPAGVGASQKGARTLVIDYMHGLGGMGTVGMIGKY
ncbi:MAG: FAD-dependent oxidoreductase, partial [bacterium]|nr:FAD-dependent oxidoreductase [bacterium]